MELKHLRYFLALAEEQNFGRAAARLQMSQPPLTRNIRALEQELGTTLFIRTPKGAELTGAGQALLDEVPNLLALATRAKERTQLAGAGRVGRLEVGIAGSGILHVVPLLLAAFHSERPEIKVSLHNLPITEQIAALRERRITLGFDSFVPAEADIAVDWVQRERFLVALYEGHPLCGKKFVTLKDLDNQPMILHPNSSADGLAQSIASAFRAEHITLRVEQHADDVVTCVALVASRCGVGITTDSAANLRLPGIVYRPLRSFHLKETELTCLYRRNDNSQILGAFVALIRRTRAKRMRVAR
jgi:DNA-binding transcriptional LysR family regulator